VHSSAAALGRGREEALASVHFEDSGQHVHHAVQLRHGGQWPLGVFPQEEPDAGTPLRPETGAGARQVLNVDHDPGIEAHGLQRGRNLAARQAVGGHAHLDLLAWNANLVDPGEHRARLVAVGEHERRAIRLVSVLPNRAGGARECAKRFVRQPHFERAQERAHTPGLGGESRAGPVVTHGGARRCGNPAGIADVVGRLGAHPVLAAEELLDLAGGYQQRLGNAIDPASAMGQVQCVDGVKQDGRTGLNDCRRPSA